jgi:PPOX class probable F420-dependent enzyme
VELDAAGLDALLARWPVARLATVTPRGRPHQVPIVFAAQGGRLYSPVDGKRKAGGEPARLRNVAATGRASVLLDHYDDDWSALWWVRLDGIAWVERADVALLDRVAERLLAKYHQYQSLPVYAGEPALLVLRWERVTAWSQSGGPEPILRAAGRP